ncbi:MAG: DUF5671 domain-containing protein [Vicinamibacterales bacterium]
MAVPEELLAFVRDALAHGQSREAIGRALVAAGWADDQVRAAQAAFAPVEFPIPVPRPKVRLEARDAFFYLLLFSTLFIVAFNFGSLVFDLIDRLVPDPASGPARADASGLRWSVSSLIVALPVYLSLTRYVQRGLRLDPVKRASAVRRWLTYLTLFIAAGVLLGDLMSLVYRVLGGELTTRFVLKTLTVGGIAGVVFGHYLSDLRQDETEGVG